MEFVRKKFNGIDGRPKTHHALVVPEGEESPFHIEASAAGIVIKGTLEITTFNDQRPFAKAVADAWVDHTKFKPKFASTLSGH